MSKVRSSERYIVFRRAEDLDEKCLRYSRVKDVSRVNDLWDIRYKESAEDRSKTIYIQTPAMELAHREEDRFNFYLVFRLPQDDTSMMKLLWNLDHATLEEMCQDPCKWHFSEETPVTVMESHFIPTVRPSITTYDWSFCLTVPKNDQVNVFDADRNPINFTDMTPSSRVVLLLCLDGVEERSHYFNLRFLLEQAKVKPPREPEPESEEEEQEKEKEEDKKKDNLELLSEEEYQPQGECLLKDDEEADMVSNYLTDMPKFRNNPRSELYDRPPKKTREADSEEESSQEQEEPDRAEKSENREDDREEKSEDRVEKNEDRDE